MIKLITAILSKTKVINSFLLLIIISGIFSYFAIPKESEPDVNIPYIFVNTTLRGISPEDAERLIIKPIEKELRSVDNVKEMTSTAYEGGARTVLEFEAGFDADKALSDVREKVDDAKPELPSEAEEPTIKELNFSLFPVLVISLSGDLPERALLKIAKDLKDDLESLPNVLSADIKGDREEKAEIIIKPEMVESYGLSSNEVSLAFSRSNKVIAAGSLDNGQGRFAIKVPGLLDDINSILNLPVKAKNDSVITLSDIATGRKGYEDRTNYARVNGNPTITIEVSKKTGANLIETVESVRSFISSEQKYWPKNMTVSFFQDKSKEVKDQLLDLQNNIIAAILLVMILIIYFLGPNSGILVGIAIPTSFFAGILFLYLMGYTLNMIVLFALIMAVGLLVDNAIVINEYADRKITEGLSKKQAYLEAATRMAWPIISFTLTTIVAFLPLAFWTGIIGEFMKFFPITLVAILSASLLMALIFIPSLGFTFGKSLENKSNSNNIKVLESGDISKLSGFLGLYSKILKTALNNPLKVTILIFVCLILTIFSYGLFNKGVEFFPNIEPDRAEIKIHGRGNLSIDEQDKLVRQIEREVFSYNSEIETIYTVSGSGRFNDAEDIIGTITLNFKDWDKRRPAEKILDEIRETLKKYVGLEIEVLKERDGPTQGKPIKIDIISKNLPLLSSAVFHIEEGMRIIGGFRDIDNTLPPPGIQWEVKVDRAQAAKFGADLVTIGDTIQMITNGLKFSSYRPSDSSEEIDIIARYPEDYRSLTQLDRIKITTNNGEVPISNFIKIIPKHKTGNINLVDSKRVYTINADVEEGLLVDTKLKELQIWLKNNPLSKDIIVKYKGDNEKQNESSIFLLKAFFVALFMIGIILITQFDSYYSAFLILSAVLFSTIGVMIGLMITGRPFGIVMNGLGVISLAGIIVNNNIILIDTYNVLKKQFKDPIEAALRTGLQRARPIMLTASTTALGLLPMMLEINLDFISRDISIGSPSMQWWSQLSSSIIFGICFGTILTLIVTPSLLILGEKLFNKKEASANPEIQAKKAANKIAAASKKA